MTASSDVFDRGYADRFPPLPHRANDVVLRITDACIAVILLLLLLPMLAVLSAAILIDSRGGVLYRQRRVGSDGHVFTMYKFRSMRTGVHGPHVTVGNDARITRVGQVLRKTSLDELPQLWNVVAGHMSLVGPRPETPDLARRYSEHCQEIFRYRPGMTGPGQLRFRDHDLTPPPGIDVEEWYLSVVVPAKVTCDLEYLQKFTLRTWLVTLFETAGHLLQSTVRNRETSSRSGLLLSSTPGDRTSCEADLTRK
jgi:lipopolysaccharide/colanic/teichoic acid biosynthesis glycosyltransferase